VILDLSAGAESRLYFRLGPDVSADMFASVRHRARIEPVLPLEADQQIHGGLNLVERDDRALLLLETLDLIFQRSNPAFHEFLLYIKLR